MKQRISEEGSKQRQAVEEEQRAREAADQETQKLLKEAAAGGL